MQTKNKKVLSVLLTLVMCLSMLPMTALAAPGDATFGDVVILPNYITSDIDPNDVTIEIVPSEAVVERGNAVLRGRPAQFIALISYEGEHYSNPVSWSLTGGGVAATKLAPISNYPYYSEFAQFDSHSRILYVDPREPADQLTITVWMDSNPTVSASMEVDVIDGVVMYDDVYYGSFSEALEDANIAGSSNEGSTHTITLLHDIVAEPVGIWVYSHDLIFDLNGFDLTLLYDPDSENFKGGDGAIWVNNGSLSYIGGGSFDVINHGSFQANIYNGTFTASNVIGGLQNDGGAVLINGDLSPGNYSNDYPTLISFSGSVVVGGNVNGNIEAYTGDVTVGGNVAGVVRTEGEVTVRISGDVTPGEDEWCAIFPSPGGDITIDGSIILTDGMDYIYFWGSDSITGTDDYSYIDANGYKVYTDGGAVVRVGNNQGDGYEHNFDTAVLTEPACKEDGYTTFYCDCGETYVSLYVPAFGHDWSEGVVVEPTCTCQGYTKYVCLRCGDEDADTYTAALGHDWNDGVITQAPTEHEDGIMTYTCLRCDETRTEAIPATGRPDPEFIGTPPTIEDYDENGEFTLAADFGDLEGIRLLIGGEIYILIITPDGEKKYVLCNETLYRNEPLGEATEGSVIITLYGDFLDTLGNGEYQMIVSLAADGQGEPYAEPQTSFFINRIAAHVHDFAGTVTAPTCAAQGFTTYTCVCGEDEYTDDFTDPLGHDFTIKTDHKDASCEIDGYDIFQCSRCGETETVIIPALSHEWISIVTAPTCDEQGFTTYTCGLCGESKVEDRISALGHDFSVKVGHEDATCDKDGYDMFKCSRCEETEQVLLTAIGHDWSSVITAPTCEGQGFTAYTCHVCLDTKIEDYTDPIGHAWDNGIVTKEPTEYEDGVMTFTCGNCGETRTESISATGHNHYYTETVTKPTCTEQGFTTYFCACGESYTDTPTAALGHDHSVLIDYRDATCEESGYSVYQCSRCDETETTILPVRDHDYQVVITDPTCEEQGFTTYTCSVCGTSNVEDYTDPLGHDFSELVSHKDATADEDGYDLFKCSRCEETKTVVIPAIIAEYANIDGLLAALEKANPYLENYKKYSKATFDKLDVAVEKGLSLAEAYAANPMSKESQSEIDAAEKAINDAIKNLKNKSLLEIILTNIYNRVQHNRDRIERIIPQIRAKIAQMMTATVTFNVDGNTTVSQVYKGKTVTQPANPVKDGYTFIGWRIGSASGVAYNFRNPEYHNITLYAAWQADPQEPTLISATPTASVTKQSGNQNRLYITVTETYSDGTTKKVEWNGLISNNAAATYQVGEYKVYVDTKGNAQIRECYIVI